MSLQHVLPMSLHCTASAASAPWVTDCAAAALEHVSGCSSSVECFLRRRRSIPEPRVARLCERTLGHPRVQKSTPKGLYPPRHPEACTSSIGRVVRADASTLAFFQCTSFRSRSRSDGELGADVAGGGGGGGVR